MVLDWILGLPSLIIIVGVALFISLLTTLVYKFATDQDKMKSIHDERKKISAEIKKNKDNPEKMMKLNKRSMAISMEVMPQTMKSMFITLIPLFLIFSWLGAHMAYEPLLPGETFTVSMWFENDVPGTAALSASENLELLGSAEQEISDKKVEWELKGEQGAHTLEYNYNNENYMQEIIVSTQREYAKPTLEKKRKVFFLFPTGEGISEDSNIRLISVDLQKTRPFGNFNIFGYFPGWLAAYFIMSMIFSMALRKLFKVF